MCACAASIAVFRERNGKGRRQGVSLSGSPLSPHAHRFLQWGHPTHPSVTPCPPTPPPPHKPLNSNPSNPVRRCFASRQDLYLVSRYYEGRLAHEELGGQPAGPRAAGDWARWGELQWAGRPVKIESKPCAADMDWEERFCYTLPGGGNLQDYSRPD